MKILFVQVNGTGQPHLGICYLSSALKASGYNNIKFCSIQKEPAFYERSHQYYLDLLKNWKPDIVGISAELTTWIHAVKFVSDAKSAGAKVIVGGAGPSSLREKILTNFPQVDFVAYGEAENTISNLINTLEENKKPNGIKGIIYRNNKKIIKNEPNPLIIDLDSLNFPDFNIQHFPSYHTPFAIITQRGCPYNCSFCFKPVHGNLWRARSPKNVVDELEEIINTFPREIKRVNRRIAVNDDCFNLNIKRAKDICDEILRRRLDVKLTFVNGFHVRTVDQELFHKLKKAGAIEIWFGVDGGSEKVLKTLGKGISLQMVRDAVRMAKKAKIPRLGAHFIIGLEGDSLEDNRKAIQFAKSLNLDVVGFNHANILPETRLWDYVKENGKMLQSQKNEFDFSNYFQFNENPIFETKYFCEDDRRTAFREALSFSDKQMKKKQLTFLRLKSIINRIRSIGDIKWVIKNIYFLLASRNLRFRNQEIKK